MISLKANCIIVLLWSLHCQLIALCFLSRGRNSCTDYALFKNFVSTHVRGPLLGSFEHNRAATSMIGDWVCYLLTLFNIVFDSAAVIIKKNLVLQLFCLQWVR